MHLTYMVLYMNLPWGWSTVTLSEGTAKIAVRIAWWACGENRMLYRPRAFNANIACYVAVPSCLDIRKLLAFQAEKLRV